VNIRCWAFSGAVQSGSVDAPAPYTSYCLLRYSTFVSSELHMCIGGPAKLTPPFSNFFSSEKALCDMLSPRRKAFNVACCTWKRLGVILKDRAILEDVYKVELVDAIQGRTLNVNGT